MELIIFWMLTFICILMTFLFLVFRSLPEGEDDASGWPGIEFIFVVIATIFWMSVGITAVDLETTYIYSNGIDAYAYVMEYTNTWPIALLYIIISVPHFMMTLFLWPESWRSKKTEIG